MANSPVAVFHFLHKSGDTDMNKKFKLLIIALSLVAAVFSHYANAGEKVYVMMEKNTRPVDDLAVECGWANLVFVIPAAGIRSDLYSIQSKKTNGVLLRDDLNKVGESLDCIDSGDFTIERGNQVIYDFGEAWLLSVHGQDYIVTGMSRLRTNPNLNPVLGIPGEFLGVSTGSIFTEETIQEVPPRPVGSYSSNFRASAVGGPYAGGIVTLRIITED